MLLLTVCLFSNVHLFSAEASIHQCKLTSNHAANHNTPCVSLYSRNNIHTDIPNYLSIGTFMQT